MDVAAPHLRGTLLLFAVGAITALLLLFGAASAQAESAGEPLAASPGSTAPAPNEETVSSEPEAVPATPSEPEAATPAPSPEPAPPQPAEADPVAVVKKAAAEQTAAVVDQVEQTVSTADLESPPQVEPDVVATSIGRGKESAEKLGQETAAVAQRAVKRTAAVRQAVERTAAIGGDGGTLTRAPIGAAAKAIDDVLGFGATPVAADTPVLSEQPSSAGATRRSDGLDSAGGQALPPAGLGLRPLAMLDAFDPPALAGFDFGAQAAAAAAAGWQLGSVSDLASAADVRSRDLVPASGNDLVPPPASPQSAASGSGGSSSFVPVAALLALLALAVPATCRRLREVPAFPAPAPFVCALERPG